MQLEGASRAWCAPARHGVCDGARSDRALAQLHSVPTIRSHRWTAEESPTPTKWGRVFTARNGPLSAKGPVEKYFVILFRTS